MKLTQNRGFGVGNDDDFKDDGAYFGEPEDMAVSVGNEHFHYPPKIEKSPLEKVLVAGALAAAIATPIGGLIALPSILDRINPPPAALQIPVEQHKPVEPVENDDANDVFELGLHKTN